LGGWIGSFRPADDQAALGKQRSVSFASKIAHKRSFGMHLGITGEVDGITLQEIERSGVECANPWCTP